MCIGYFYSVWTCSAIILKKTCLFVNDYSFSIILHKKKVLCLFCLFVILCESTEDNVSTDVITKLCGLGECFPSVKTTILILSWSFHSPVLPPSKLPTISKYHSLCFSVPGTSRIVDLH